jgi:hypothetical protein
LKHGGEARGNKINEGDVSELEIPGARLCRPRPVAAGDKVGITGERKIVLAGCG